MPAHYLKVNYESTVTWRMETDHLRCSPDFFHHPRYDCILFKTDTRAGVQFARLKDIFLVYVDNKPYPIAMVEPFDVIPEAQRSVEDCDLGLCRVRMGDRKKHNGTIFIHAQSIIRGALIVTDHGAADRTPRYEDYLVIDVVDSDMFLRCRSLFPFWYTDPPALAEMANPPDKADVDLAHLQDSGSESDSGSEESTVSSDRDSGDSEDLDSGPGEYLESDADEDEA